MAGGVLPSGASQDWRTLVSASAEVEQRVSVVRRRSRHDSRTNHSHIQRGTPGHHSRLLSLGSEQRPSPGRPLAGPTGLSPWNPHPVCPLTTRKSLYLCFPPEKQEGVIQTWAAAGRGAVLVDLVRQEEW